MGLADRGIVQSTRGYLPMMVSHYKAQWIATFESLAMPSWPMIDSHSVLWNREKLHEELIEKWKFLANDGSTRKIFAPFPNRFLRTRSNKQHRARRTKGGSAAPRRG
jgi:hypothetical protein